MEFQHKLQNISSTIQWRERESVDISNIWEITGDPGHHWQSKSHMYLWNERSISGQKNLVIKTHYIFSSHIQHFLLLM